MSEGLFQCREGLHALQPSDPLDPAGTSCICGAIALIAVYAAVKADRKIFLHYLIDTDLGDGDDDD